MTPISIHMLCPCPWIPLRLSMSRKLSMEKTWATLYHTGELVDILVGGFCRTSDTHAFESLMRWLLPFSKPHAVYKWIWGRGYAKLPVHEFLLAVDDSPQKFELLIGIARREATFQPMRDFDCIASITKLHQEVPGRASRAIQSLSYMIFFSPYSGGSSDYLFQMVFLLFSSRDNAKQQIKCFLFILFRVFQSRATLSCFMMLYSYLWFEAMFALAADLDIYIWLFTSIFTITCPMKFVSRFHKTGQIDFGVLVLFF